MAKIRKPIRLTEHFKIDPKLLNKSGSLNPILNADTKLFIDPMLLASSKIKLIAKDAVEGFEKHFRTVISFLKRTKSPEDVAAKTARRLLTFPEFKGTCLGYGGQSVSGSGSGDATTEQIFNTAKQVVDLGVDDPDLFVAMALFEENFGPDHISDMTTNVILPQLIAFSEEAFALTEIPKTKGLIRLKNGNEFPYNLPINPYLKTKTPIVLVPKDILRKLPIARSWSDISDVTSHNSSLRNRVNKQVGKIWEAKTRKDKAALKDRILATKEGFASVLEVLKGTARHPYDFAGDPDGVLFPYEIFRDIPKEFPLKLGKAGKLSLVEVNDIVAKIIEQFKFLIEHKGLHKWLYHNGKPRHESAAQMLFFAVAFAYCEANNLDLTPEADTGNGKVDFKVSQGASEKVVVEMKLSTNRRLYHGYTRQLEEYRKAEKTTKAHYVVIDVGRLGAQFKKISRERRAGAERKEILSNLVLVEGVPKASASKR